MRDAIRSIAIATAVAAPASGATPLATRLPLTITTESLPNGLRVVLVPMPGRETVAYYTLFRVGARNEVEPGHTGFAHLFEHMMFRGSERFSAEAQERLVQRLGYDDNAFTWDDMTVYTPAGPSRGLAEIIPREADRAVRLRYDEAVFRTEARAVLGEYNKSASHPSLKLEEALLDAAFTRHTYKHTTIGFLADIQAMPERYEYSWKFYRRYYRPDNAVIFVVGGFDPDAVMAQIRAEYGAWRGKAARPRIAREPPQRDERRVTVPWSAPTQKRLLWGWHTPSSYRDDAIQQLLASYLFGPTGRLHKELVLTAQTVESFEPWYEPHRDPRLFAALAVLKRPAAAAEVERALDEELARVRQAVDPDRFAALKDHRRYGLLLALETPSEIATRMALATALRGDLDALDRQIAALEAVTAQDLVAFARRHLVPANRTVVTLEPPAEPPATPSAGGAAP